MKKTQPGNQVDLVINFFQLANKYESDGTSSDGWFKCLLIDLASEKRGKVLIRGMSELSLKWIASPDGISVLKKLNADYLTFTIAGPESNSSHGWHDKEFEALFNSWSSSSCSSLKNSPFDACVDIKCVTVQLGGWYIYLKGYDERPFPNQTYMIILPGEYGTCYGDSYEKYRERENHWIKWRSAKYGIVYD